jgi:hypothetical protein
VDADRGPDAVVRGREVARALGARDVGADGDDAGDAGGGGAGDELGSSKWAWESVNIEGILAEGRPFAVRRLP